MACDPNQLVADAKCIQCNIPNGAMPAVMVSLLAQIAGVSNDPNTLVKNASPLQGITGSAVAAVIISLLCQIAKK